MARQGATLSVPAFVLDSSIAAAAVLPDEETAGASAIVRRAATELCAAPLLWRYEIANTLEMARRRKRISNDLLASILAMLFRLRIRIDETDSDTVRLRLLPLAQRYRLTLYDAAYLELAMRLGAPLATLDEALRAAARAEAVPLLPA